LQFRPFGLIGLRGALSRNHRPRRLQPRGNNLVTEEIRRHAHETDLLMRLLIAEPDGAIRRMIQRACGRSVRTLECADFQTARTQLSATRPDALVTNLRLHDYNGLHLVLLARASNRWSRCVVHTNRPDSYLIREAQEIGAFFERTDRLPQAISGYLLSNLPERDRRNPERFDRRTAFRGGRRAIDQPVHV
jgi:DNA-binding NtrC family response regulator